MKSGELTLRVGTDKMPKDENVTCMQIDIQTMSLDKMICDIKEKDELERCIT